MNKRDKKKVDRVRVPAKKQSSRPSPEVPVHEKIRTNSDFEQNRGNTQDRKKTPQELKDQEFSRDEYEGL